MVDYKYKDLYYQDSIDKQLKIEAEDGTVITNTDIFLESMSLDESICSEETLTFGLCEASKFYVKIANQFSPLYDQWITVSETLDGHTDDPFQFGIYKVESDNPTADRIYREITAYDALYDIINADMTDIADWYNTILPEDDSTITMKDFRSSFIAHFGLEEEEVSLPNDSMIVEKTISPTSISGKTVINAICEINGCFGHIGRDGKFQYIRLGVISEDDTTAVLGRMELGKAILGSSQSDVLEANHYRASDYEDYECATIDQLRIREEDGEIGCSVGNGENCYTVTGNFLVYGKGTEELTEIAYNLFIAVSGLVYRPSAITATGNPCVTVGDDIIIYTKYQTIKTYILTRTLTGIQALKDDYESKGTEIYSETNIGLENQIDQLKGMSNTLTRSIEETRSEIKNVDEGLTSLILQTAEEINLRVEGVQEDVDILENVAVTGTDLEYYKSTSPTELEGGEWTTESPEWEEGFYIWERNVVTTGVGESTVIVYTEPVCVTGNTGADGEDGESGRGINEIIAYYAVSGSDTWYPTRWNCYVYQDFSSEEAPLGWILPGGDTECSFGYDAILGYYAEMFTPSSSTGGTSIGALSYSLSKLPIGTYHLRFKVATREESIDSARLDVCYGVTTLLTTNSGDLKSDQWTEYDVEFEKGESTGGEIDEQIRFFARNSNYSILLTDIVVYDTNYETNSVLGEMVLGTAVLDDSCSWQTSIPEVRENEYLWISLLVFYSDSTTEWIEPFCTTDASVRKQLNSVTEYMSQIEVEMDSIILQVQGITTIFGEEYDTLRTQISEISLSVDTIDLRVSDTVEELEKTNEKVGEISTSVDEIDLRVTQTETGLDEANEKISEITIGLNSITLNVTDNKNGTASIILQVNEVDVGDADVVTDAREAFEAESSSIEISAGVITFDAKHIIIEGDNFSLDEDGNATFAGELKGATGSFNGDVSATSFSLNGATLTVASQNLSYSVYQFLGSDASDIGRLSSNWRWTAVTLQSSYGLYVPGSIGAQEILVTGDLEIGGEIMANDIGCRYIGASRMYTYGRGPGITIINENDTDSGYTGILLISWSGNELSFQIGSGGENRGIYDYTFDEWMIYDQTISDGSKCTYMAIASNDSTTGTANVWMGSAGRVRRLTGSSSIRYKDIIGEMEYDEIEKYYDLPVYWFTYKTDYVGEKDERYKVPLPGFTAEDWNEVLPAAVDHNENGECEVWNNTIVVPLMFEMIKNDHSILIERKSELDDLRSKLEEAENKISQLEKQLSAS